MPIVEIGAASFCHFYIYIPFISFISFIFFILIFYCL